MAPVDGVYLLTGSVVFQGGTGFREMALFRNNTAAIADDEDDVRANASNFLSVSTAYLLAAGDEVRMKVQQTAAAIAP